MNDKGPIREMVAIGWLDVLSGHSLARRLGLPGYTLPERSDCIEYSFDQLRRNVVPNIRLVGGEAPSTGRVFIHRQANPTSELRLVCSADTRGAVFVLGADLTIRGDLRLFGRNQIAVLAGGVPEVGHSGDLSLQMWGHNALFFFGQGATTNGTDIVVTGNDMSVVIGDDCMFATQTSLYTHDQHTVIDLQTETVKNSPGHVLIEPHVWLGRSSSVAKGVCIGLGSIVGEKALVTKTVPRFTSVGGVPARVLASHVTWDRMMYMRADTIERVKSLGQSVLEEPLQANGEII